MIELLWRGTPAPAAGLTAALRRAGIEIRHGGRAAAAIAPGAPVPVIALATPSARLPAEPPAGPWLWLCARAVPVAAAIAAARAGAYETISLADGDAAARLAARATELAQPAVTLAADGLIAASPAMQAVLAEIARAAATSMPVLLTGETGTGKDVLARLLHARSARAKARLVAINCAAVPNELIESELFGYVRGAFSGATQTYDGQLAAAEGGTVFLDEIDDTPPTLQAKLLRVLEDRVVSRLGENVWRAVDFRIVAATNREPADLIARGVFADDLYQRLAIIEIHLPPLRERSADLPGLVQHFVGRFYAEEPGPHRHAVAGLSPPALAVLEAYPWPGNVRELRNVVYQAMLAKRGGDQLLVADLPAKLLGPARAGGGSRGAVIDPTVGSAPRPTGGAGRVPTPGRFSLVIDRLALERAVGAGDFNLRRAVGELERTALELALARGGTAAAAARLLGEVGRGEARDPGATVRAMMRRLRVTTNG